MIWDKYAQKFEEIYKPNQFHQSDFVEENIKDFVGTEAQIKTQREFLKKVASDIKKEKLSERKSEINELLCEYQKELFNEFDAPVEVLSIAYNVAYDRGHSYGYVEVENIFFNIVDNFIDCYNLGKNSNRP